MEIASPLISFLGRLGLALVVLSLIYLRFGPPGYEEVDLINSILYLMIVPLALIGGTIAICFLVGMPIRLIPKVFDWWCRHQVIPVILLTIGILCCFLSIQPQFIVTVTEAEGAGLTIKKIPNSYILVSGWFLTAFSLTHLYFKPLLNSVRKIFKV